MQQQQQQQEVAVNFTVTAAAADFGGIHAIIKDSIATGDFVQQLNSTGAGLETATINSEYLQQQFDSALSIPRSPKILLKLHPWSVLPSPDPKPLHEGQGQGEAHALCRMLALHDTQCLLLSNCVMRRPACQQCTDGLIPPDWRRSLSIALCAAADLQPWNAACWCLF